MFRFFAAQNQGRLPAAILLAALLLPTPAGAASKAAKEPAAPAPPQPVAQKVSVQRGQSVEIPLRIYGTRAQTLSWIIRQQPTQGKLSLPRPTAPEAAQITYTASSAPGPGTDRFTFSARSNEGVSAAVEVSITIVDADPLLLAPGELEFETLLTGSSAAKPLEIANIGGGIAEGDIFIEPPWRLDGDAHYKLAAGERHRARILFVPSQGGKFAGEVRFSSHPGRSTHLRGSAEDPLGVSPSLLELHPLPNTSVRAGVFEVRNRTAAPLELTLIASQRLHLPATIALPASGSVSISAQTAAADTGELEEPVRIAAGSLRAQLRVRAAALPPLIQTRTKNLTLRRSASGAAAPETLSLQNEGGQAASLRFAASVPFAVEPGSLDVPAGGAAELAITVSSPASTGAVSGGLKILLDGKTVLEVPLLLEAAPAPASAGSAARPTPAAARPSGAPSLAPIGQSSERPVLPGVRAASLLQVTTQSATFEWPGSLNPGTRLRCLRRSLTPGETPSAPPSAVFVEYPATVFAQNGSMISATVESLLPGQNYFFRIDAVAEGGRAEPLRFVQFKTPAPPQRSWPISWLTVLVALGLLTGAAALRGRWRNSRSGF